ncbi:MAG: hypothetical protein ACYDBX_00770 [Patescibacteria group bacterium]
MKKTIKVLNKNILLKGTNIFLILSLFLFSSSIYFINNVNAAQLTPLTDTMSNSGGYGTSGPQTVSTAGVSHSFSYTTPTAYTTSSTIDIYIQTGSTIGGGEATTAFSAVAASSVTVNGTAVATPTVTTGVTDSNFAGYTFTEVAITVPVAISSGATVTINGITATNPSTASSSTNQYVIDIQDSNSNDGYMAVPIITNGSVAVTGRVTPTITFSLSSYATSFGVMQLGVVNTSSPATTLTVSTNAQSGAIVYVYDHGTGSASGLYNSVANHNIPSTTATLAGGTEGYGINAATTSTSGSGGVVGTMAVSSPYNGTGDAVGGLSLTSTTLATGTAPMYAVTIQINYLAAISVTTPAGIYNDQVTYVATGKF